MHFKNSVNIFHLSGLALEITLIILITSNDVAISGRCPLAEVVSPCECDSNTDYISCIKFIENDFNSSYTLPQIFQSISASLGDSEKNFTKLLVAYTHTVAIEENTFADITFESIEIFENNLTRIHSNAFARNQRTLKTVSLNCYRLSYNQANYSVFDALSAVVSLEVLTLNLGLASFTQIPSNAFRNINGAQTNLREINFVGMVSSVGDNAFSALPNLQSLKILDQMVRITEHAFDFSSASTQPLILNLASNRLVASSFEPNAFNNTNRPVQINLARNGITYLDENIFFGYINSNGGNKINVQGNALNCSDCRNYWIVEQGLYRDRIEEAVCNYGAPVENHNWICESVTPPPSASATNFVSFYALFFLISLILF